jgi:hypothetical protein
VPDYSKLAAEYKEKQDNEARRRAAEQNRAQKLLELFQSLEVHLERELRKAEDAFGTYGFSGFSGPEVSLPDRTLGVRFGAVTSELEIDQENNLIRIHLKGETRSTLEYALEYEKGRITIYKKTPEGGVDRATQYPSSEIVEKMVMGLIHGNFD